MGIEIQCYMHTLHLGGKDGEIIAVTNNTWSSLIAMGYISSVDVTTTYKLSDLAKELINSQHIVE